MKHESWPEALSGREENSWVIFDMDGTLWDTTELITEAWNTAFRENPSTRQIRITREQLLSYMGKTMDCFARALLPELPFEEAMEVMGHCMELENSWLRTRGAVLYPGLEETFAGLADRHCSIGIISNCQQGYIEAFLDHYSFRRYVSDTLCWGDTGRGKADNLRQMIEGHRIGSCCYVGDTQGDLDACREAGVPFVYASYGFGSVDRSVPEIRSLTELLTEEK